ncbi:MAG: hypothetical protein FWG14_03755 [Peptococcaceae bacterium]|nr:hypothetical protein [Peptococcaceae bacterium]
MEILSIRHGFASDHSSTSYEFLAVDKPLGKKERSDVSRLSSRANPTARRVNFRYNVEGYDIPGGWEKLMGQYYDVMYSEEYSWWTLAIAFNSNDEQYESICAYEFDGADDLGIRITRSEQRVIIAIYCVVEVGPYWNEDEDYEDYEDEDEDKENNGVIVATGDHILDTLVQVRKQVINGDYRALYAVFEVYGVSDEDNTDEVQPPKPKDKKAGSEIVKTFKEMLTTI